MLAIPPPPPSVVILAGAYLWQDDGTKGQALVGKALAIKGSKIAAIGPKNLLLQRFPKAQIVDLEGGTLLPGFIEGHCHVESLGRMTFDADLRNTQSLGKALECLQKWNAANPEGWIQGRGWDQNLWPGQSFPTAADLDRVTGSRPAILRRVDGHALWANSAALQAANITSTTKDPQGGQILRNTDGSPTGILLDNAIDLMEKAMPPKPLPHREACVQKGLAALQRLGFTSACDMGGDATSLEIYRRMAAAGTLPIRVFSYFDYDSKLVMSELRQPRAHQLSFFQVQGVKFYFDGALGSRGARMMAPYADAPNTQGLWLKDPEKLAQEAALVLRAGYQPAAHAIGDAANHAAVELLGKHLQNTNALSPRVEHAQIVAKEDAAAFGKAGLVASVQPMHMSDDHAWTPTRLGAERQDRAFPWRTFLKGGAKLVFGSDAPIADANPFLAMAAAETRQDANGDPAGGFLPEHRLTRTESLRAYTRTSAEVLGHKDLGVLREGAVADLLWIQAPVLDLKPEALRQIKPGRMWVNGAEIDPLVLK